MAEGRNTKEYFDVVLQDFNVEIRESVHEMFCCARLSTKGSLNACVMALLTNLNQYPQDKLSIWK